MAKQPRARQAKSRVREAQFYDLVEKAKGKGDASGKTMEFLNSQPRMAITVEDPSTMGRRKKLAGKEGKYII